MFQVGGILIYFSIAFHGDFLSFFFGLHGFFFGCNISSGHREKNVVNKEKKKQVVIGIECKMTTDAESSVSERVSEPE